MAVYNGEAYIREQLESIIYQSYSEWQLYIRDDGSTDGTKTILNEFKERYKDKIILVNDCKERLGAKGNFVYLFNHAIATDYYLFCDQDDVWKKNKLQYLLEIMRQQEDKKPVLIYHNMEVMDRDGSLVCQSFSRYTGLKLRKGKKLQQLVMYNCIPGCCMMFNYSLKMQIGKMPNKCFMHDWWVVLVSQCLDGTIIYCNKTLGSYRQHGNNEVGAVKKEKVINNVKRSLSIWKIKRYYNNNLKMRNERLEQVEVLLHDYKETMTECSKKTLLIFTEMLLNTNKIKNLFLAIRGGYTMWNLFYTLKFYLL